MFKGLGFLGGRSVAEFLAPSELNGAKNIQLMELSNPRRVTLLSYPMRWLAYS